MGVIKSLADSRYADAAALRRSDARAVFSLIDSENEDRRSEIAAKPDLGEGIAAWERPGHNHRLFTADLTGRLANTTALPASLVANDSEGWVVRLAEGICAHRMIWRLEPGRLYQVRAAVRRRTNSPDPANDAVEFVMQWLNSAAGGNGETVVTFAKQNSLTTGDGRQEITAIIALSAGDNVDHVAPANTVFVRPFVRVWGNTQRTDVEVLSPPIDITTSAFVAPDLDALDTRVAALESLDIGNRLDDLESVTTGSEIARFKTRNAAIGATIPASVDAVEVLGFAEEGDRGHALYVRVAAEPSHAGKFASNGGTVWWELRERTIYAEITGAKGDASTDDAVAANNAVSAAGEYGTVELQGGRTYVLNTQINLNKTGVVLNLNGATLKCGTSQRAIGVGAHGVKIVNGFVDANGLAPVPITSVAFNGVIAEDLEIRNPILRGLSVRRGSNFRLKRVHVVWDAAGVAAVNAEAISAVFGLFFAGDDGVTGNSNMNDCEISECKIDLRAFGTADLPPGISIGIRLQGDTIGAGRVRNLKVRDNNVMYVLANEADWAGKRPFCYELRRRLDNADISNNFSLGGHAAYSIAGMNRGSVSNNRCEQPTLYGIESVENTESVFSGNDLYGGNRMLRGISVNNTTDCVFSGGVIRGGDGAGGHELGPSRLINIIAGAGQSDRCLFEGILMRSASGDVQHVNLGSGTWFKFKGCTHRIAGTGSQAYVHGSGTLTLLQVLGATIEGGTAFIRVDAGATITTLQANDNAGVSSAGPYVNNGAVGTLKEGGNVGIGGLS